MDALQNILNRVSARSLKSPHPSKEEMELRDNEIKMLDYQKRFPINPGQIQFWTAEMWSLLWNLWYFGKETKVTKDLDFSWATDDIRVYEQRPILHMAGVTDNLKTKKFFKGDFINVNPLDKLREDETFFDYIEESSSTKKYVELMKEIVKKQ